MRYILILLVSFFLLSYGVCFGSSLKDIKYPKSLIKGEEDYLRDDYGIYFVKINKIESKPDKYFTGTKNPISEIVFGEFKIIDVIWGNSVDENKLSFSFEKKLFGGIFKGDQANPFLRIKLEKNKRYIVKIKNKYREGIDYLKIEIVDDNFNINQYKEIINNMNKLEQINDYNKLYIELIHTIKHKEITPLEIGYCLRRIIKYRNDREKRILNALDNINDRIKKDEKLSLYVVLCVIYVLDTTDKNECYRIDEMLNKVAEYSNFIKSNRYRKLVIDKLLWINERTQTASIEKKKLVYDAVKEWNSDRIEELKKSLNLL